MSWIDLAGRGDPVLLVAGRVHLRPEDIADPDLRRLATALWDEFARVRHLAEPVAETLARLRDEAGGPVSLRFPDPDSFRATLDGE
jgi:hypothetical protein